MLYLYCVHVQYSVPKRQLIGVPSIYVTQGVAVCALDCLMMLVHMC